MSNLSFAILLLGLAGLAAAAMMVVMAMRLGKSAAIEPKPPYVQRPALLTEVEQVLFKRLTSAFPDHLVFCQVHLPRVLEVRANGADYWTWFNGIKLLSLDYLVCTPSMCPVLAIELDDRTHDQPDRKSADQRKTDALQAAGLRLVRIKTTELSSITDLKSFLEPDARTGDA
jgi:Protein of unknown function (DUF2726)